MTPKNCIAPSCTQRTRYVLCSAHLALVERACRGKTRYPTSAPVGGVRLIRGYCYQCPICESWHYTTNPRGHLGEAEVAALLAAYAAALAPAVRRDLAARWETGVAGTARRSRAVKARRLTSNLGTLFPELAKLAGHE